MNVEQLIQHLKENCDPKAVVMLDGGITLKHILSDPSIFVLIDDEYYCASSFPDLPTIPTVFLNG
jgi:hypothetical protein